MQKKSRLGDAVGSVDKFFQAVWTVIRRLNLQPLLTVGVVWLALCAFLPEEYFTKAFHIVFIVLGGLCVLYAIAATCYSIAVYLKEKKDKPAKRRKKSVTLPDELTRTASQDAPVYYRVAQNPKYVMAEYKDRYELYYDDDGEYTFVKSTLKNREDKDTIDD